MQNCATLYVDIMCLHNDRGQAYREGSDDMRSFNILGSNIYCMSIRESAVRCFMQCKG